MSERTFVLIHIVDEHRIITGLADNLPASGLIASDTSKFMLQGEVYDVLDVMDHFGDTHAFKTGERLLAVLTKMTGNQKRAAALLEAAEPMFGRPQNAVVVDRTDDGTISVRVPDNDYYALSIVRALKTRKVLQGQQLADTAEFLIAAKSATTAPTAVVPTPASATTAAEPDPAMLAAMHQITFDASKRN